MLKKGMFIVPRKQDTEKDSDPRPLAEVPVKDPVLHVKTGMRELPFWEKFKLTRETQQENRRVLGEIIVGMLEQQKQAIMHELMLSLDVKKKDLFVQYLRRVEKTHEDLIKMSNEMQEKMEKIMYDDIDKAIDRKMDRIFDLDKRKASGRITDKDYEEEVARVEKWNDTAKQNIEAKVEILLQNHAEALTKTLEVFKERVIKGESIL